MSWKKENKIKITFGFTKTILKKSIDDDLKLWRN
jgi:hypothetical protein